MLTLVTGATKGIGLALAQEFARQGNDLILVSRDEKTLKEVSYQLMGHSMLEQGYTGMMSP